MTFADTLQNVQKASKTADFRRSLIKAGLGIAGLAALPLLSHSGSFAGGALRMLAGLTAVTAAAFFALRFLSERKAAAGPAPLRVVARAGLSQKASVAIIEADGERLVLAYGDGFAQLLSKTSSSPEIR